MTKQMTVANEFLKRHQMHPDDTNLDVCARAFQADMVRGLAGEADANMMMLPAYLSVDGTLPLGEPVIVIDAGGTNFRIALVTLTPEGHQVESLKIMPMPGTSGVITWAAFVRAVADEVLPLTDRSKKVGLCFSYAAEILANGDGKVVCFSKQVVVTGSEDQQLGRDISAALAEMGAPDVQFIVLNDTVAAQLGGMASLKNESYDGYMGLIYGTGVNTCYAEAIGNIPKVTTPWEKSNMMINMESARFADAPRGTFDLQVDADSVDPGRCLYEKMVSGRYEGEVIFYALRQAAWEGLLSEKLSQWVLGYTENSLVVVDTFTVHPYGDNLLANACDTDDDRELVYAIIDAIVERSAKLVCANIAGVLMQMDVGHHIQRPACIVAEGSTFHKGYLFKHKLRRLCDDYITGQHGIHYVFRQVDDANLLGTAAAVLLNR